MDDLLTLARLVIKEAGALGIKTTIIGAAAMARYGYVRANSDIDLAACRPIPELRALASALRSQGLHVTPDEDDALGGWLDISRSEDGEKVQVVNFWTDLVCKEAGVDDSLDRILLRS